MGIDNWNFIYIEDTDYCIFVHRYIYLDIDRDTYILLISREDKDNIVYKINCYIRYA